MIRRGELRTGMKLQRDDGVELITMIDVPDIKNNTFKSYFVKSPESKIIVPTKYSQGLNYDIYHPQNHICRVFIMRNYSSNPFSAETEWVSYKEPLKIDDSALNNYMKKYDAANYHHHEKLILSDLHTGLKVELRNGVKYICMTDVVDLNSCTYKDFLLPMDSDRSSLLFEEYNADLSHKQNTDYDIVKVKTVISNYSAFKPNSLSKDYIPIVPTQEDINNYIKNYC